MFEENYTCVGCQRNDIHFMCPAYGTHFYMSGVPYTEQIAEFYDILDKDDKEKFFNMLSECCNLWNKYIPKDMRDSNIWSYNGYTGKYEPQCE